jgi:hypothetical protein
MSQETIDAAKIGSMFVTRLVFQFKQANSNWNDGKEVKTPARWEITAELKEKPSEYSSGQTMTFTVEQGIGQKLAEVLLPVVMADASRKAQELADSSKAMIQALGERAIKCLE